MDAIASRFLAACTAAYAEVDTPIWRDTPITDVPPEGANIAAFAELSDANIAMHTAAVAAFATATPAAVTRYKTARFGSIVTWVPKQEQEIGASARPKRLPDLVFSVAVKLEDESWHGSRLAVFLLGRCIRNTFL